MIDHLRHSVFAVLTACAILCGLGHQIAERFAMHHHCAAVAERGEPGDDAPPAPDHEKPCGHPLCAHSIVAAMGETANAVPLASVAARAVPEICEYPPRVEPAEIEHPPQLG